MNTPKTAFNKGYTYTDYRQLVTKLFEAGESTGPIQNADMLHYSEMNIARMSRWDKHLKLDQEVLDKISRINQPQKWLLLTEGWCGDAAHSVPVIAALADANPEITLRIILRDEHLDIMDAYLTNGGRSIPKLIIFNDTFEEQNIWGPRPEGANELMRQAKEENIEFDELKKRLQLWYSKDKGQAIQREIAEVTAS